MRPAQHEIFFVKVVWLACAPVEMDWTVTTPFQDVPQHRLQRCKSSPARDHQQGALVLLVDELSDRSLDTQQGADRQSIEQLLSEAAAGDPTYVQLQQIAVVGRTGYRKATPFA